MNLIQKNHCRNGFVFHKIYFGSWNASFDFYHMWKKMFWGSIFLDNEHLGRKDYWISLLPLNAVQWHEQAIHHFLDISFLSFQMDMLREVMSTII